MKPTFDALGIDFAKRREMTDEYIKVLQELWTKDSCTFEGKYVQFKDVSIYPKPVQKPHPPIWIAGNSYKYVNRSLKFGNGIMLTSADPRLIENFDVWSKESSSVRSGGCPFDFAIDIFAGVVKTDEKVHSISGATLERRVRLQANENALKVPPLKASEDFNLIGSRSTIVEKVSQFKEKGVSLLEVRFISRDMDEMTKTFARDVIPSV